MTSSAWPSTSSTSVDVYVTVKAAEALEDFTANQRAPILVWAGQGYQIINQAPGCELRASLFAGVDVAPGPGKTRVDERLAGASTRLPAPC